MKRHHYRLRFALFDGKTPLWWVTTEHPRFKYLDARTRTASTNGHSNSGDAIRAAARL